MNATRKLFRAHNLQFNLVRWYSHHQVESDYLSGAWKAWPADHIELLRWIAAGGGGANPNQIDDTDFVAGVQVFRLQGRIQNPQTYADYKHSREHWTRMVLQNANVVFSSCVASHNVVGYDWNYLHYLQPKTFIIDEYWCAKPYDLAIPLSVAHTASRAILAGDPFQLGPTYKVEEVRNHLWALDIAKEQDLRRFRSVVLDEQHRTHSSLYAPVSRVIYNNAVKSHHKIEIPRAFLSLLQRQLPCSFRSATVSGHFHLTQYAHFLHVAEGCQSEPGSKSLMNTRQALVVNDLVLKLLTLDGITPQDITVVTHYNGQMRVVKALAETHGWFVSNIGNIGANGNVVSIGSSRGTENEIVILPIVRSFGDLEFVGNAPRATVALTRPKEALFVIGDWDWLQKQKKKSNRLVDLMAAYSATVPDKAFVVRPVRQSIPPRSPDVCQQVARDTIEYIRTLRRNYQVELDNHEYAAALYPPDHPWQDIDQYRQEIPNKPVEDLNWNRLETRLQEDMTRRSASTN